MSIKIESYEIYDRDSRKILENAGLYLVLVSEDGECFDVLFDKGEMFCVDMDGNEYEVRLK